MKGYLSVQILGRPLLAVSGLLIQQFFDDLNDRFPEKRSFEHVRQNPTSEPLLEP